MRPRPLPAALAALLAGVAVAAGCGDGDDDSTAGADRPAKPPAGWRTVVNGRGRFTVAAPRSWRARSKGVVSQLDSPGRFARLTIRPDRSAAGRDTPPSQYARQTLEALPDFEGSVEPEGRQVEGTPYASALIRGRGTIATSSREQEIAVAALHLPDRATFAATVFGYANRQVVEPMLASIRAGGRDGS